MQIVATIIAGLLAIAVVVGLLIVAPAFLIAYAVNSVSVGQALALVVAARLLLPFNFNVKK